jgi:hypothetical protein
VSLRRAAVPLGLLTLGVLVTGVGCGHPATREECEVIFDKSAELSVKEQNITDPAVVAERVEAFKQSRGDELIEKCVGRSMTKSALECVKRATSASAVDQCLM